MEVLLSPRQCVKEMARRKVRCPTHEVIRQWALNKKIKARYLKWPHAVRGLWQIDADDLEVYLKEREKAS
jgi:hypothetical protein